MKKIRRQKVICLFCMFLTAFSLFGETLLQMETAEAATGASVNLSHVWKECQSVSELETYLGGKIAYNSTDESRWKDIIMLIWTNNGWAYFDPSTLQATTSDWKTYNGKLYGYYMDDILYYLDFTGGVTYLTAKEQTTLADGYLVQDEPGVGNAKMFESNLYQWNYATFQFKFSDEITKSLKNNYSSLKIDDTAYRYYLTTVNENGHCVFHMNPCQNSNGGYYFTWWFWKSSREAMAGKYVDTVVGSYYSEVLFYIPAGESLTTYRLLTSGDIEKWDWDKYNEWITTSKGKNANLYKEVSGNYSLNSGETVTYTGDVYIPAGATLTIPTTSTLIIGSNCTVLCDGVIQNNGTLIVEPGAVVSYYNRDYTDLDMVATNIICKEHDPDKFFADRCIVYNKRGTAILGVGTEYLSAETKAQCFDSSGNAHVALLKNGIYNNGNLIIRKHAGVDIPRFTQSTSGKTWLYGTMDVEEIFQLGGNIVGTVQSTCLPDYNRPSSSMNFNQSNGILSADSNFTIDEGMLYLFSWKTDNQLKGEDLHQDFWYQSADDWDPRVNDDAYYRNIYPFMGTTDNGCFNLIGKGSTLKDYISYSGARNS